MTCASFESFDLLAYLDDPRAESFAAFRAHYPGCPECAAEVRESTELRQLLEGARSAHPDPELLLRFEDARSGLAAQEAARIESHLQSCTTCREELDSLRGLDAAALGRPAAAPLRVRPTLGARLRWLLWQPAVAYALLFATLAPQLYRTLASPARPLPAQSSAPAAREEKQSYVERLMRDEPAHLVAPRPSLESPATRGPASEATSAAPAAPPVPVARPARREPPPRATPPAEPEPTAVEPKPASDLPAPAPGYVRAYEDEAPGRGRDGLIRRRLPAAESSPAADPLELELRKIRQRRVAEKPAVTLTRGPSSIEVRVPMPAFAEPGSRVALVLRDAEGRRELRELRTVAQNATFLSIDLPLAWATPGSYEADVLDARPGGEPKSATYSFTID